MSEIRLSDFEFQLLRRMIYQQIGIALGSSKKELVQARLASRLRELGIPNYLTYYRFLRSQKNRQVELQELVNRITTNTTTFFREKAHFKFLAEEVLPAWRRRALRQGMARLRMWSAGCSTGQEPYSMAAVVQTVLGEHSNWDIKILATDVSSRALAVAQSGRYADSYNDLPAAYREPFAAIRSGGQLTVAIPSALRMRVVFRLLNLLSERFPFKSGFDVLFCRNVLIYFDEATRTTLIRQLVAQLVPGGYLFLGMSEGLVQIPPGLAAVGQSIYRSTPPIDPSGSEVRSDV